MLRILARRSILDEEEAEPPTVFKGTEQPEPDPRSEPGKTQPVGSLSMRSRFGAAARVWFIEPNSQAGPPPQNNVRIK